MYKKQCCLHFTRCMYLRRFTACLCQTFIFYIYVICSLAFILNYHALVEIHDNVHREQRIPNPKRANLGVTSHDVTFHTIFLSGYPGTVSSLGVANVTWYSRINLRKNFCRFNLRNYVIEMESSDKLKVTKSFEFFSHVSINDNMPCTLK